MEENKWLGRTQFLLQVFAPWALPALHLLCGVFFLPNLQRVLLHALTRKGECIRGVSEKARKGRVLSSQHIMVYTQRKCQPGPRPLKRLFHTAFNLSLRKAGIEAASEPLLCFYLHEFYLSKLLLSTLSSRVQESQQSDVVFCRWPSESCFMGSQVVFDIFFEAVGSLVLKTQIQNNSCCLSVGFSLLSIRIFLENNELNVLLEWSYHNLCCFVYFSVLVDYSGVF